MYSMGEPLTNTYIRCSLIWMMFYHIWSTLSPILPILMHWVGVDLIWLWSFLSMCASREIWSPWKYIDYGPFSKMTAQVLGWWGRDWTFLICLRIKKYQVDEFFYIPFCKMIVQVLVLRGGAVGQLTVEVRFIFFIWGGNFFSFAFLTENLWAGEVLKWLTSYRLGVGKEAPMDLREQKVKNGSDSTFCVTRLWNVSCKSGSYCLQPELNQALVMGAWEGTLAHLSGHIQQHYSMHHYHIIQGVPHKSELFWWTPKWQGSAI